jgi:hypothetical protein
MRISIMFAIRRWFRKRLKPAKPTLTAPLPAKPEPPAWIRCIKQQTKRPAPPLEVLVSRSFDRAAREVLDHDTVSYYHAQPGQKGEQ